jgi:hypothetical protein
MAHGTRNRVWRVAVAGVGALLCGGLVGCMNTDKPKDKVTTKPGVGLPGTPTLTPGGSAKAGTPTGSGLPAGNFTGAGAGLQQPRVGTTGQNTNTGTGGTGIQQTGGFGTQPGLGAGVSPPSPPASLQPGGPPAPSMPWPTNYPPTGTVPTNPVLPPTDITPPPPQGAPGASVLPPQPVPGAPTSPPGLGPVAPIGGPN